MTKHLPPQTKADRRALATFDTSAQAAVRAFTGGIKRAGETLQGKRVIAVTAATARQFWAAGQPGSAFKFDRRALRYMRGAAKVAPETVKAAAEAAVAEARFKIADAALRLQQGRLEVADWIVEHDRAVKVLHGANASLARGGFGEMTAADWDKASGDVAKQYGYSRAFAEDVARGRYGTPGVDMGDAVLQRAGMYADAGRATYENTVVENAKDRLGHTKARRILGDADSCPGCIEAAADGWVDIESILEIGGAECLTKCNCIIVTSTEGNEYDS